MASKTSSTSRGDLMRTGSFYASILLSLAACGPMGDGDGARTDADADADADTDADAWRRSMTERSQERT